MKTIEKYEKTDTKKLKLMFKKYEELLEKNELEIDKLKYENKNYLNLKEISDDYEIDINIIRMILTKRMLYQEN